jgi:transcription elongation factor Elf1
VYKIDSNLKKKKETKLECFADKCEKFELTIAEDTLNFLPKDKHIYTAKCGTCKKVMAVKAKELLSFERVFGPYEIATTKSTFDKLFE